MATYSLKPQQHDIALGWTIGLSIILHLIAVLVLPSVHIEKEPPEPELVIELAPIKKVEPPQPLQPPKPEANPEPVKPEQKVKPEPTPAPKVTPSPEPVVKSKSTTTETPPPQPSPEVTAPPVIAVAPKAEATPVVTAPPPPPPPEPVKTGPSQTDIDAAKNQYGSALARELAKHKQYPKIAQMRGWEGEVILELQLDSNGNVVSSKVHDSSTFDALDKQALEMVKKANFPPPPEALRGRSFNILVPVSFKLE
ncbi:MAG TPA: energy transducer TonB [Methylophilaceae bacterium]